LRADAALAGSTIWVIAQRRFIELQGCVTDAAQAARAQALVQAVPDVQAVWARLAVPGQTPAYPLAASAPAR
jgi:osmotically-inducible protein OsmY